jgi:hypothetical protein
MKEIMFAAFRASAMVEVMGMEDDPAAKAVGAFVKTHPDFHAELDALLTQPETDAEVKEMVRAECESVLAKIKAYVGE